MDGLLEEWRLPLEDPGAEPIGADAKILRQFTKGLYGNKEKLLIQRSSKIEMFLVPKPGSI